MKQLFRERLRRAGLLPALFLACGFAGAMRPAQAAGTYTVTSTLDDGSAGTLRSAVALANADPGATITFGPGVSGVIALQGTEMDITASMTITGPGAGVVQVDGGGVSRLFNITAPSAQVGLSGLTLQNGSGLNDPNVVTNGTGGSISSVGTLVLTGCVLRGSTASYGAAIYNSGTLMLTGCTLNGNVAGGGAGGAIYNGGALALTGCTLSGNSAFYAGGLYNSGTTTLTACNVSLNSAVTSTSGNSGSGAGLYNDGGLTLTSCVVSLNSAYGGSADNGGPGGSGAGLYSAGTLTMSGCTVSGNTAGPNADGLGGVGAGLDNQGAATLTDDIFYADAAAGAAEVNNDTTGNPSAAVTAAYCDIQGSSANPASFGANLFGPTNFDSDPLFVSASADFHLQPGSPCIGQGIADPSDPTDHDGSLRLDPPSLGAYEHVSPAGMGVWTTLGSSAPEPIGTMLLLTDGTVMGQGTYTSGANAGNGNADWFRLTPDVHGSYVNGSWTQIASMHSPRTYYASAVLRSGKVLVAGGEYTDSSAVVNTNAAEVYDPVADVWTQIAGPGWSSIGDAPVKTLADGTVLLGSLFDTRTALYSDATNTWTAAGNKSTVSAGESWALLPDQTVLTVASDPNAEKYLPSNLAWVAAGQTPVGHGLVQNGFGESGPAVLLPGGQCLFVGATGHTALYAPPSDPAHLGVWTAGPDFPTDVGGSRLEAKDAPGCLLVNGKVLCVAAPLGDNVTALGPQYFFEYAPDVSGGTLSAAPGPGINPALPARTGRMLALPSGQVLYSNLSVQLAAYTPSGSPNPAWKPAISGGVANPDGSYQVVGTQFNGLSEGASGGAGAAVSTNYPLVRLTDRFGGISYARTFNHSTMGLATGDLPVSTNFVGPATGTYQLQVVANGIASNPVSFIAPAGLVSLTLPSPVPGGTVVTATVILNALALSDTVVGLSSSDASVVRVHRAVIVPAGAGSATFLINTYRSHVTKSVTITATLGHVVRAATLTIKGR